MKILIITNVYPPDPASVGQHMADIAQAAAKKGHCVRVLTSNKNYDDPRIRYAHYEILRGVEVIRLKWSSFGKKTVLRRLLGQVSFTIQCITKSILGYRPNVILISTAPPLGIFAGLVLSRLKKSSLIYWIMDINPDEAIALGLLPPNSIYVHFFEKINKIALKYADYVIVLDSVMARRIRAKARLKRDPIIIPPWPHEDVIKRSETRGMKFRKKYGLEDKFIFMYSGNHSWVHPLDTILEASKIVESRSDIVFLFVGGGVEKEKIEEAIRRGAQNIISLPYQSLDNLGETLAAADVHFVVMGNDMVGIVHPCKIYGAMAAGRPILAITPDESHIAEIIDKYKVGMRFRHGDASGVADCILKLAEMNREEIIKMGENSLNTIKKEFSQEILVKKFLSIIEDSIVSSI